MVDLLFSGLHTRPSEDLLLDSVVLIRHTCIFNYIIGLNVSSVSIGVKKMKKYALFH